MRIYPVVFYDRWYENDVVSDLITKMTTANFIYYRDSFPVAVGHNNLLATTTAGHITQCHSINHIIIRLTFLDPVGLLDVFFLFSPFPFLSSKCIGSLFKGSHVDRVEPWGRILLSPLVACCCWSVIFSKIKPRGGPFAHSPSISRTHRLEVGFQFQTVPISQCYSIIWKKNSMGKKLPFAMCIFEVAPSR